MGRNLKPIHLDAPFANFANGLRALMATSSKNLTEVADKAHYCNAAISAAVSGWKLPTWYVTRGIVLVCEGDEAEWFKRWDDEHRRARGRGRS